MSGPRLEAPPPRPASPVNVEKREFMKQYVLNRALANDRPMDGIGSAQAALAAWTYIETETTAGKPTRTGD